MLHMNISANKR